MRTVDTSAVLASFCSLSSCVSLAWTKPLSTEWSWRLHSLRIRSMPLPSSRTSSSTFSRDTLYTDKKGCFILRLLKHTSPETILSAQTLHYYDFRLSYGKLTCCSFIHKVHFIVEVSQLWVLLFHNEGYVVEQCHLSVCRLSVQQLYNIRN